MTLAICLLVALAVSITSTVLIAVKSLEALREAFRVLEQASLRADSTRSELLDRLASRDLDHYKLYSLAENGEDGEISINEVDETTMEEIHQGRPWIPVPRSGPDVPLDLDPERDI